MKKQLMGLVCLAGGLALALAKTPNLVDLPVSVTNNPMCLSSMTERPWWNEAWTKRMPLLVAGQSDETDDKVVVDTIVDFGEPVDPKEVRVVTPWETEVDCVAEAVRRTDTLVRSNEEGKSSSVNGQECPFSGKNGQECPFSEKVRLLFKTTLRPHQNKPFLVYFGYNGERTLLSVQKGANGQECPFSDLPDVRLAETADAFHIRNGVIDVVFDRRHGTEGLIRSLRILGSTCETVLFACQNGYAKAGFVFRPNAGNSWDAGRVVMDNALAKSVRFDCADATLTFTLYAEQPRIDWSYELKRGNTATVNMHWGVGDGCAFDDFFYCGKAGEILTERGSLDHVTDCEQHPSADVGDWLGEGWYAFGERRMPDIAGLAFDRTAVCELKYTSSYGPNTRLVLGHKPAKGEKVRGSGAIVATLGTVGDFRKICRRIERPVAVSVGAKQDKVFKPYRIPRFDHDWCVDYNGGYSGGWDCGTATPVPKDPEWAERVANIMRSYGSTSYCIMGYPWWMMPLTDKSVYDKLVASQSSGLFEDWARNIKLPTWEKVQEDGKNLQAVVRATHGKGMGLNTWAEAVPGWNFNLASHFTKEFNDLELMMTSERIACGQDCAYSMMLYGEGVKMRPDLVKANGGSTEYWTWKNPQDAFDAFDTQIGYMKEYYRAVKERHPDKPVFLWNSEDGSINYEKFMSDYEGSYDTLVAEFHTVATFNQVKHYVKRLRMHFNNAEGHTIWHHYYNMRPDLRMRIKHIEMPFLYGMNGFTQENMSYEMWDKETSEMTADFFRFAEYTRLGEKVAKMAPVKNLGVYRDPKLYRADILAKRIRRIYHTDTDGDARVRSFSEFKNLNYDLVGPKYFTAKDLAKYRVVYVPEDEVFSEAEANELLAYVKNGGSAIIEGVMGEKSKAKVEVEERRTDTLRRTDTPVRSEQESNNSILRLGSSPSPLVPDTITPYGQGKILWFKDVLTERVAKKDAKAMAKVRKAIADMGGVEPYTISALNGQECPFSGLDGNLQAGPEGMFLGLYNSANEPQSGVVTLRQGEDALATKAATCQGEGALAMKNDAKQCGKGVPALADKKSTHHSSTSTLDFDSLYVLDVKRGTRVPLVNNTFTVTVEPEQCAYYLIGDDAFTSVPAVTAAMWMGASAESDKPIARKIVPVDITGFRPVEFVEIVRADKAGKPVRIARSAEAKYAVTAFTAQSFEAKPCAAALKTAKVVHFVDVDAATVDQVFGACGTELKDLLARGGSVVITRSPTGPVARKFFAEIGVFDPNPSAVKGIGDTWANWCGAEDHPFLTCDNKTTAAPPEMGESKTWHTWRAMCGYCQYGRVFGQWDAAKQQRLFQPKIDGEKYAAVIAQEQVLGAGKVIFNENQRCFTDWYESRQFGDNFFTWLTGVTRADHAKKMTVVNGGPGNRVR